MRSAGCRPRATLLGHHPWSERGNGCPTRVAARRGSRLRCRRGGSPRHAHRHRPSTSREPGRLPNEPRRRAGRRRERGRGRGRARAGETIAKTASCLLDVRPEWAPTARRPLSARRSRAEGAGGRGSPRSPWTLNQRIVLLTTPSVKFPSVTAALQTAGDASSLPRRERPQPREKASTWRPNGCATVSSVASSVQPPASWRSCSGRMPPRPAPWLSSVAAP